jgi:rare lipoprotein A
LLKRTLVALLGLSVLLFCVNYAAQSTIKTREHIISEDRVVSLQAGEVEIVVETVEVETNAQTQNESDNNAAVLMPTVVRAYNARASWYRHGNVTANGERYNPLGHTVAHKSLPFGTMVRFTNPETGESVVARVNDRGPFIKGREFDLSLGSARAVGMERRGVMVLRIEILS